MVRQKRIGITMRVDQAQGYSERRDALAQDWQVFMKFALPEVHWMPIPNIGEQIVDFIKEWNLEGIIFSGGNDIGSNEQRDMTEREILSFALSNKFSIFGVCRGLQLLQTYFGGRIETCSSEIHVARKHKVDLINNDFYDSQWPREIIVNSYHNFGIKEEALNNKLISFARTNDGWVEGVVVKDYPIVAVMWHPERGRPFREFDRELVRKCFGLE
ncbi:MAG: gamma-glutamyl-gamma-aminobutyrate hydrolase family protein [Candidatus Omnitrophica bacterium]|nr:gamma-glutamyl-gamma-aminobutyrate hydrolase family protein [Candidatus Omnitrophota bacterium]